MLEGGVEVDVEVGLGGRRCGWANEGRVASNITKGEKHKTLGRKAHH